MMKHSDIIKEPTSQSEKTTEVIFKVVLPQYFTQFFDKVDDKDLPDENDIFGAKSYMVRYEKDGEYYTLGKSDRTEETLIKNYGNTSCESYIRRVTIVVEKYDDKVSIKLFDFTKRRGFGKKYFKKSPNCIYLTYNKKTNDLFYGTTTKVRHKRSSTIKRNRFEAVQRFYAALHTTCENLKANYYSQVDPICSDEIIVSAISAKTLSWNKFISEIDPEFFKENCYLGEGEKFFKYYLTKRNIKYPDNFEHYMSLNRVDSRLLKKSGRNLVDGIMLKYGLTGKKIKRVLHSIDSQIHTHAIKAFSETFGEDILKKITDNQLKKLLEMSYYGLTLDSYGLKYFINNCSKKEYNNFFKIVLIEHIENSSVDIATLLDHLRFYKFLKEEMETDVEWKSYDLKSFREEHVDYSTEYSKLKNVLSVNRKYGEKFKESVNEVFEYNGQQYYPVLLEENKDYILESVVQSNCVRTYVESPSMIISFRIGEPDSDDRASLEYKLTKRNNRLRLNRVQSRIRFNQSLPDELENVCQMFDSYLNSLMDDFETPKLIKERFYGNEELSLQEENGVFTWSEKIINDLPF